MSEELLCIGGCCDGLRISVHESRDELVLCKCLRQPYVSYPPGTRLCDVRIPIEQDTYTKRCLAGRMLLAVHNLSTEDILNLLFSNYGRKLNLGPSVTDNR